MALTAENHRSWETVPPLRHGFRTAAGRVMEGTLHATAIEVEIDPGIINGWLPRWVRIPEPWRNPHPLRILWGWQQDVSAFVVGGRFPLPWRLNYAEIITAVPDLRLDPQAGIPYEGPVTFLPRLYMNSWRAALLGRAAYGFRKAFATIEESPSGFYAVNRHGEHLLTATVVDSDGGRPASPTRAEQADRLELFDQPVVLDAGCPLLARFELERPHEAVRPVAVEIDVRPRLLSYLPAIRRSIAIDAERGAAFQFSAHWTLRRLMEAGE
jgi:hypothetical protein